ncbi:hypothetical protein F5Y13DRAFT_196970 [Hypoxylon sp. FL1857]|nr:hypothetical protein F5Y13DRAFT_196970 [Hypoxylon sp. FL1857]
MTRPNRLKRFIPRAGMIYEPLRDLLGRPRSDTSVMIALEQANYIDSDGRKKSETKWRVDQAFAQIFSEAVKPDVLKHLTAEGEGVLDFLDALRSAVPWIHRTRDGTLLRLGRSLIAARKAWLANPRPPFEHAKHCSTALEIDKLIAAASDRWSAEYEAYFVLGGLDGREILEVEHEGEGPGGEPGTEVDYVMDWEKDEKKEKKEKEEESGGGGGENLEAMDLDEDYEDDEESEEEESDEESEEEDSEYEYEMEVEEEW